MDEKLKKDVTPVSYLQIRRGQNDRPEEEFDPQELEELAQSIHDGGLIQPLTVRPIGLLHGQCRGLLELRYPEHEELFKAERCHCTGPLGELLPAYEIVAGERRFRAHGIIFAKVNSGEWEPSPELVHNHVECIIREMDDKAVERVMLVENLERADLSLLAEARAYKKRLDSGRWTLQELSEATGKSTHHIRTFLAFLEFVLELRYLLERKTINEKQARLIVRSKLDAERQRLLAKFVTKAPDASPWYFQKTVEELAKAQEAETQTVFDFWLEQATLDDGADGKVYTTGPKALKRVPYEWRPDLPLPERPPHGTGKHPGHVVAGLIELWQEQGYVAEAAVLATAYRHLVYHGIYNVKPVTALE